jgi:putative tricarboxylic transport membrane protein
VKVNDALLGLVLLVFAICLWAGASTLPNPSQQPYGPGFFPKLLAALLVIPAILLMVSGWRERGAAALIAFAPWTRSGISVVRFLAVPVAVAGYVFLVEIVGFLPIATLVMILLFALSHVPLRRAAPLALCTALVAHTVFYIGLGVQLPWGLLAPIAW